MHRSGHVLSFACLKVLISEQVEHVNGDRSLSTATTFQQPEDELGVLGTRITGGLSGSRSFKWVFWVSVLLV